MGFVDHDFRGLAKPVVVGGFDADSEQWRFTKLARHRKNRDRGVGIEEGGLDDERGCRRTYSALSALKTRAIRSAGTPEEGDVVIKARVDQRP